MLLLNLLVNIYGIFLPTIGNIYYKNLYFPLIGRQYIETKIIKKNVANIKLEGIITTIGTATYYENNNKTEIMLSKTLLESMNKLQCNFYNPEYDIIKDEIIFKIFIKPLFYNKKIILKRYI